MQSTEDAGIDKDKNSADKASGKTQHKEPPEGEFLQWEFLPRNPHLRQGLLGGPHPLHLAAPWHMPLCLSRSDLKPQVHKMLALLKKKIQDRSIITA